MDRLKQIVGQISGPTGRDALLRQSPDDVVVTMAIRSPLCKAKKGGFKDARTDELMLEIFKASATQSDFVFCI